MAESSNPPSAEETALTAATIIDTTNSTEPKDPLADIPPLTTYKAESQDDIIAGLKLIADSIAQQRQVHAYALIFHPLIVALWVALLAICAQFLYKGYWGDLLLVFTTWAGIVTAVLLAIRLLTSPYLEYAEQVGTYKWLGKDSDMIVSKYGEEIIGAVIILITKSDSNIAALEPSPSSTPSGRSKATSPSKSSRSKAPLRGLIRGWAVRIRYRHKGIGTGLLEEAVRYCKSEGVNPQIEGSIEFADDHANSRRAIPDTGYGLEYARLNRALDRRDRLSREMLDRVIGERMGEKVKRSKGGRKK